MLIVFFSLEELYLQPSLTKDSLFIALKMATVKFPVFNRLSLGYIEPFQESGRHLFCNLSITIGTLHNSKKKLYLTSYKLLGI
jgi:hypothetical protein